MVIFDDWSEKVRECLVRIWRGSINTNSRVSVLAARQDALLKGDTEGVSLVVVLIPDSLGEVLAELTASLTLLELRETSQVINVLQVTSANRGLGRLLFDGLRLLLLNRLGSLGHADGLEELLALVNLEGFNWRLLLFLSLRLLMSGDFCGSNVFCGRLRSTALLCRGEVTLFSRAARGKEGGNIFSVAISLDDGSSFRSNKLNIGPVTTLEF